MKYILTLMLALNIIITNSHAQKAGIPDSSFGINGLVITPFYELIAWDASIQKDNKIIICGEGSQFLTDDTLYGILVIRYNTNGLLDSGFGLNGMVAYDIGYYSSGTAIAVQQDGKIVVAGRTSPDMFDEDKEEVIIIRFLPDGRLDSSFGKNGQTITGLGSRPFIGDMAIQPDGKILLGGSLGSDCFVNRYTTEGKMDSTFGTVGYVTTDFNGIATMFSMALQPGNKILLGGNAAVQASFARYMSDGSLDAGFGNGGKLTVTFNQEQSNIFSVTSLPDGGFIAAGKDGVVDEDLLVAKFNNDGSFNAVFGENGFAVLPYKNLPSKAVAALLQPDNKILVTGHSYQVFGGNKEQFLLYRLLEDGSLDASFGINGVTATDFGTEFHEKPLVSFFADNKIVTVGQAGTTDIPEGTPILLARYNNDISVTPPPTPIARIKRWLHKHGITWEDCPPSICNNITGYAVQRSSNGINWSTVFRSPLTANRSQTANSYADPSPLPGANYYRLQTTSVDGAVAYSNVIAINNELSVMSISPNPARSVLRIEGLPTSAKTKITVANLSGNVAISLQLEANSASYYNLNIAALKPGNYLLRIETEGEVVTKQFVKE